MSDIYVPAKSIFEYENNVWIYQEQFNYLIHYDLKQNVLVSDVCLTDAVGTGTYCKAVAVCDTVCIIPELSGYILFYDIISKKMEKIEVPDYVEYGSQAMFCDAIIIKNYLYCMPVYYKGILIVDVSAKKIVGLVDISDMLKRETVSKYFGSAIACNDKIIGLLPDSNKVYLLDTNDLKCEVLKIGNEQDRLTHLANVGEHVFAYSYSSDVIYDYNIIERKVGNSINVKKDYKYKLFSFGQNILLDSINGGYTAVIDKNGNIIYELMTEYKDPYRVDYYCDGSPDLNGRYYYNSLDNFLYKYNGRSMDKVALLKVDEKCNFKVNDVLMDNFVLYENRAITLDSFVRTLTN